MPNAVSYSGMWEYYGIRIPLRGTPLFLKAYYFLMFWLMKKGKDPFNRGKRSLCCSACTCYPAGLMGHCLEKHGWEAVLKENEKTVCLTAWQHKYFTK